MSSNKNSVKMPPMASRLVSRQDLSMKVLDISTRTLPWNR